MKEDGKTYWIAFCVGFDDENKRFLASCLTFWALNRFHALQAVAAMLPDHENWTRSDGSPHAHRVWKLTKCKPEESDELAAFYLQTFTDLAGLDMSRSHLDQTIYA